MEHFKSVLTMVSCPEYFPCYIINATIAESHSLKYACTWRLPLPLSPSFPPRLTRTRTHTQTHTHTHACAKHTPHCHSPAGLFLELGDVSQPGGGGGRRKRWGSTLINYLRHSGVGLPSAICLRYGRELEKEGGGETAREEEKRKEETLERKRKENEIKGEQSPALNKLDWGGRGVERKPWKVSPQRSCSEHSSSVPFGLWRKRKW